MNTHSIDLIRYCARSRGNSTIYLGTAGSHGNEQLQVTLGKGWEGLTVQVVFHPCKVAVQLPANGVLDVPWEATARPLTALQGRIVFQGFDQDRLVNSTDLAYTVASHSPALGRDEQPYTPGIVEGVLNQMAADKDAILQAAQQTGQAKEAAAASAAAAASSAANAQQSAGAANTSAGQAAASASQAAGSAAAANETLTQVQTAGQEAQQKVKDAETEALDKIAAAAPALPAISADAAWQSVTVKPDGSGYNLAALAPIEATIRPTVTGNPAVCENSAAWGLQGLKIYGKSVQNGTPSPENPVPIMSVGTNGSVEIAITGLNLLNPDSIEIGKWLSAETGETEGSSPCWTSDYIAVFKGVTVYRSDTALSRAWTYDVNKNPVKYKPFTGSFVPDINGFIRVCGYNETSLASKNWVSYTNLTEYEPYTGQTLTLSTPSGLSGIPVDSGGNHTDASGQQWVCCYADYAERKIHYPIKKYYASELRFTLNEGWTALNDNFAFAYASLTNSKPVKFALSNAFDPIEYTGFVSTIDHPIIMVETSAGKSVLYVAIEKTALNEVSTKGVNQYLSDIQAEFVAANMNPSETSDMSGEEISAYRALTTYSGATVVSTTDPVAVLDASYIMDGNKYRESVDKRLAALEAAQTGI